jgi:hypothetical protein
MTMNDVVEFEMAGEREIDVKGGMVTDDAPATGYEDMRSAPIAPAAIEPKAEPLWYRNIGLAAAGGMIAGFVFNFLVKRAKN